MGRLQIREAVLEDLDFLHQLEGCCFPCHRQSSRRSLRTSITSASQQTYILERIKNKLPPAPVGAATVFCYKHALRIYSIAIHPDYRGHGMGDFLLRYLIGLAQLRGCDRLTLEADSHNRALIDWYRKFSFVTVEQLEDYYGPGEPACRMVHRLRQTPDSALFTGNVIVVDQVRRWRFAIPGVEIVSARDYLSAERFRNSERYHVLNLCQSYRTHSLGYYVSLLAAARNHRLIPSVMAMKDVANMAIAQSLTEEIRPFLDDKLQRIGPDGLELMVVLGKTPRREFADLAKKLFTLFEIPFFIVQFARNGSWKIRQIRPLSLTQVTRSQPELFQEAVARYFQKKRHRRTQLKQYKYDLAILVDPKEKTPPSCPQALERFRRAGEQIGFFVEFIGKMDYRRICEFDALFIRETTAIENHTYRFARHAYTEGLVVIDDPWSILHCSNKIYLHERLARARLRQPRSWLLTKTAATPERLRALPFPLVLKLPESSFSLGVYKVGDLSALQIRLKQMFAQSDLVIAQEFLETAFDWRIGVLDHAPLFACKYYMARGHWQVYNWGDETSADFAGQSEAIPLQQVPPHILKAAVKSSSLIGDGLYGVDLKDVQGQAYVIEINDNPNIDVGIEDALLQDELYLRIMASFFSRIERERHQPRYLL